MHHTPIDHDDVVAALASNWFCMLATSSAANRPHVAGVLYALVGRDLYVNTDRDSRKAGNIAENDRVAVCIPVLTPLAQPPFTASLQGTATLLATDDPTVGDGRVRRTPRLPN